MVWKCSYFTLQKKHFWFPLKNPNIPLGFVWKMRGSYSPSCCPDAPVSVNGKLEPPQATSLLEGSNAYSKCATLFACI